MGLEETISQMAPLQHGKKSYNIPVILCITQWQLRNKKQIALKIQQKMLQIARILSKISRG